MHLGYAGDLVVVADDPIPQVALHARRPYIYIYINFTSFFCNTEYLL